MTRKLTINESDEQYNLIEDEKVIFSVDKNNLLFDSSAFYKALFDGDMDTDIQIKKPNSSNKELLRVYHVIEKIIRKTLGKL